MMQNTARGRMIVCFLMSLAALSSPAFPEKAAFYMFVKKANCAGDHKPGEEPLFGAPIVTHRREVVVLEVHHSVEFDVSVGTDSELVVESEGKIRLIRGSLLVEISGSGVTPTLLSASDGAFRYNGGKLVHAQAVGGKAVEFCFQPPGASSKTTTEDEPVPARPTWMTMDSARELFRVFSTARLKDSCSDLVGNQALAAKESESGRQTNDPTSEKLRAEEVVPRGVVPEHTRVLEVRLADPPKDSKTP